VDEGSDKEVTSEGHRKKEVLENSAEMTSNKEAVAKEQPSSFRE
jgi:hypothetical protein